MSSAVGTFKRLVAIMELDVTGDKVKSTITYNQMLHCMSTACGISFARYHRFTVPMREGNNPYLA